MSKIHSLIKSERETLGLTQEEFGKKLGVGRSAVSNWEAERKTPDITTLQKIADIFGCSLDYLCGRTDNKKASILEQVIDGHNIRLEIDKDYFKSCTPSKIQEIINDIRDAGFDISKFLKQ